MMPDLVAHLDRIADLIAGGRPDLAATDAARLRALAPHDAEAARLHGIALFQLGRGADAIAALEAALARAPQSVDVLCNLASVRLAAGDAGKALEALEAALMLAPAHPAVLNGLGNARGAIGDLAGARDAYAAATQAQPGHVGAWCNLAAAELALGDPAAAEGAARRALALAPGHPEAHFVLGHALAAQRRHAEAEAAYAEGERVAPHDARFPYQRGLMLEERKQLARAADAHARALALDPGLDAALGQLVFLRRQLCDWRGLEALSTRLRARVAAGAPGLAPFGFLAEPAGPAEQWQCARTHSTAIERRVAALRTRNAWRPAACDPRAQLRVGFVANGFANHPTALLVVAFVEALRAQAVEIHLFSTAPADGSTLQQRLRAAAHAWHDAHATSASGLAESIHAERLDVLLDLDGYCAGAMPEALALRPAPLQVNWLAYPGTLAAPWIDYVIADRIVLPESLHAQFSECVAWLPRCFQPSDPTRVVGTPPPRPQCGLPASGVVYACLNASWKLDPATFERMLSVLRAVPDSVLWLLSAADGADDRLRGEAARRGVHPSRLVFAPKLDHASYLARYRHADLFLDSAPYGAHTTASDAIWAGCPVLTVAGPTFASRVAASLNHHLGLAQLNAPDDAGFVESAVRLGHDAALRASLREAVATRRDRSGLFDMHGYARDFAELLARMVERRRAGLAPAPLQ
ncbi:tetratricopeptide repeat protein [Dokdonella sp.]|uniref:O-linked N-acetylglucosamine transferase, SPINDLY family protein n=1 Tax=Dokdonella sp. TaxID=2291710 RepID=UPI002F3ECDA3